MKKDIHPKYYPKAKVICACGNTWTTGSTQEVIHTEMCSACHPFFTGEQRIVDTAGQVERFQRRKEVADRIAEEAARRRMEKQAKEESIFEFVTEEEKEAAAGEAAPAEQAAVASEKPTGKRGGRPHERKGKGEAGPKAAGRRKPAQGAKRVRAKGEAKPAEPTSE